MQRSVAEDYRHARQVKRLLQGVCAAQMLLTTALAVVSVPVLLLIALGFGFGLAASFGRVQRQHALCMVFNVSYLIASLSLPSLLAISLGAEGSIQQLSRHLPRHTASAGALLLLGVLAAISCVLGAILAGYVLRKPLMLYRYETVAADEEAAELRSQMAPRSPRELTLGGFMGDSDEPSPGKEADGGIQPIDAWLTAGPPRAPDDAGLAVSVYGPVSVDTSLRGARSRGAKSATGRCAVLAARSAFGRKTKAS